jgi:RNA polymerase sigma-70 factor (ECF subfamily)
VKADVPRATTSLEQRFRTGVPAALTEVIAIHQPLVSRLVYRLTAWSRTDTEDIVQEVFVNALRSRKTFDARSSLATWLTRITINTCCTERRKRLLRTRYWKRLLTSQSQSISSPPAADLHEDIQQTMTELRRLPATYREAVVLRYLEEMEIDDIARLLNLSRPAVEVRLHRARAMLRTALLKGD